MALESKLQSDIISWLKINGVYVIKVRAAPGVPVGCPDIIGLYRDKWLAIECKADEKATFQPGQKLTLQTMQKSNPFVYVAYPENWPIIKAELAANFL